VALVERLTDNIFLFEQALRNVFVDIHHHLAIGIFSLYVD